MSEEQLQFPFEEDEEPERKRLVIDCEFSVPQGMRVERAELEKICEATAGYFSFLVNELVCIKTGQPHKVLDEQREFDMGLN